MKRKEKRRGRENWKEKEREKEKGNERKKEKSGWKVDGNSESRKEKVGAFPHQKERGKGS